MPRLAPFAFVASLLSLVTSTLCLAEDAAPALPLKKVVLFSSGVGFYEHEGKVTGDAAVDLKFNVKDVNDLLKSMVPQDLDGGAVSTVTYGSMDPITKTLQTFAVDLTRNPTMADLLDQVRGEHAVLETSKAIQGTILGVERRKRTVKDEVFEETFINMLTEDGLTSVPLAGVQRIKLLNEDLDADLRKALSVLALGRSNDKKTVSLKFSGKGERRVRVGYIQESPLWKTSYRLVLGDEAPLLQGWAIVENATEEDWKDVDLALVSGRPISFTMDLYQPLYVPRPVVEPELFASLRPQTYGQDLRGAEKEFAARRNLDEQQRFAGSQALRKSDAMAAGAPASPPMAKAAAANGYAAVDALARNRSLADEKAKQSFGGGVQSAAASEDVGELFQYVIDAPVNLARQKSAMLPIVAQTVKGDKVSIYNPGVHAKHPLNGLRFVNTTALHLMQGPITVYDDGAYAGDAQIEDLPPGTERLISYAMDLDTEVASTSKGIPSTLLSMKLARGVLQISNRLEREQSYVVKNSGAKTKQILIEYPLDTQWKLLEPTKPAEKTRDRYRFQVAAEPGKPAELKIREEQIVSNQVALSNGDQGQILIYLRSKVVSDGVRKAIEQVRTRQGAIGALRGQLGQMQQQINVISQEQDRIRQNMNQLDRNSELYLRYVKKFGEQEDQVEKLRGEIEKLQTKILADQQALDAFLSELTVE